jgi:hypothetical protein
MTDRELDEKLLRACGCELVQAQGKFERTYWQKAVDEWKKLLDK